MQSISYSIRYENQIADKDTITFYTEQVPSREQLAKELAAGYLASEVFDSEDGDTEFLGEPIACQIGKNLWEIQFRTPFCAATESVVVRFFHA